MPDEIYLKDLQEVSIPDLADVLLGRDTSDTVERKFALDRLLGLFNNVFQARLTTETGVAVSTSDRTSQSTLYLTPYNGNKVSVYDGTRWVIYALASDKSLALSGLTSGKNYDVFLYYTGSTLALELSAAWSTDTARTDALTTQDGVIVKSGATSRRWVGTIRTTSTTTTADSLQRRFVWNKYNQVFRYLHIFDTDDHTYNSATVREWNGGIADVRIYFVLGEAGHIQCGLGQLSNNTAGVSIGVDTTSAYTSSMTTYAGGQFLKMGAPLPPIAVSIGYHYVAPVQNSGSLSTFYEVYLMSQLMM
jgi:hypothetical protein